MPLEADLVEEHAAARAARAALPAAGPLRLRLLLRLLAIGLDVRGEQLALAAVTCAARRRDARRQRGRGRGGLRGFGAQRGSAAVAPDLVLPEEARAAPLAPVAARICMQRNAKRRVSAVKSAPKAAKQQRAPKCM